SGGSPAPSRPRRYHCGRRQGRAAKASVRMARKAIGRPTGRPADGWLRAARIFEEVQVLRFGGNIRLTAAARAYAEVSGLSVNHILKVGADIDHCGGMLLNDALDRVERRVWGVTDGRLGRWKSHPIPFHRISGALDVRDAPT